MIWQVFDNMEQCSAEEVQRLLKCVSSQRAEKAMSYKRLQHQYACLKAYDILHKMLEEQGVIAKAEPLYFDLSLHGKPYISRYLNYSTHFIFIFYYKHTKVEKKCSNNVKLMLFFKTK